MAHACREASPIVEWERSFYALNTLGFLASISGKATLTRNPTQLGVADATSVPDSDLVPVQLIYPDRVGETYTVRPNPDHRWFYLSEQTPREVLLIKCFDSKVDGRARRVPHSAFVDEANEGESPRESIEVRALVFHPDDVE